MELSCEKVSARLQPATAGYARLVLSKTVPFFCTSLYTFGNFAALFPWILYLGGGQARCDPFSSPFSSFRRLIVIAVFLDSLENKFAEMDLSVFPRQA